MADVGETARESLESLKRREVREFNSSMSRFTFVSLGIGTFLLTIMAYFNATIQWMAVCGFALGTLTICSMIRIATERYEDGRGDLEQANAGLKRQIEEMQTNLIRLERLAGKIARATTRPAAST
jgi:hypothetical protein